MECKREGCRRSITGKVVFCSGACRTAHSRASVTSTVAMPADVTVALEVLQRPAYGRRAVLCAEFGARPEPLDSSDQPVPHNRGRYNRPDGTVYQFDTTGRNFECKHPFTDRHGNPHLAVYGTAADVRQATGVCL